MPFVDFTEALMWPRMPEAAKRDVLEKGVWLRPTPYAPEPCPVTRALFEDGRNHLLLGGVVRSHCPVHILQGMADPDVPWQHAMTLVRTGQLGELRHLHSYYLQGWLAANTWGNKENLLWRLQTAAGSGGVLGDLGCHILDLTTAVGGEVARIRCDLRTFPKITADGQTVTAWQGKPLDANDTANIELEFTNGAIGLVHTTRWATGHSNSLRLEAHGTTGALMFDLDRDYHKIDLILEAARNGSTWTTEALPPQ